MEKLRFSFYSVKYFTYLGVVSICGDCDHYLRYHAVYYLIFQYLGKAYKEPPATSHQHKRVQNEQTKNGKVEKCEVCMNKKKKKVSG